MIRFEVIVTHEPSREPASAGVMGAEPAGFEAQKLGDGVLLGRLLELFKIVWPIVSPYLPKPATAPPA